MIFIKISLNTLKEIGLTYSYKDDLLNEESIKKISDLVKEYENKLEDLESEQNIQNKLLK